MSKKWYPVIDTEKCIGCGACIANCKHGVYKIDSAVPKVVNPENCVEGCEGCGNVYQKKPKSNHLFGLGFSFSVGCNGGLCRERLLTRVGAC